jgi:multidrug efflux pump subunit AcrB
MSTPRDTAMLGLSGRIARYFQSAQITPLLGLLALLMGLFAVAVTPREEEPQINVTMANVLIPFPGASARDVEQLVVTPAEQVLAQIADIDHVMSVSRPGLAVITVQFKVGVPRTEALVRLYDTIHSNRDWLPPGIGVGEPLIKPKGIDDVPIVTLTLFSRTDEGGAFELERIAHALEAELKRVAGTREVKSHGGPGRAISIRLDPARLASVGLTVADLTRALQAANLRLPLGTVVAGNQTLLVEAGPWLTDAQAVAEVVVAVRDGRPLFLGDIAVIDDGAPQPTRYVWHGIAPQHDPLGRGGEFPAVTISVTKKPGENAVDVANALLERIDLLRGTLIPDSVEVALTRNYGATADDKAKKLIQKLLFATASVVALVFFALGRREAAIVGSAVVLTLAATLFASWAWGFTLNRVSLFALIFSIGILVDDAIVVVENIHRHRALHPQKSLAALIPGAVDEVGGPTILATLTVIAALLPMAFVTGLMGPYMSPIPINASMGMLISLVIAFVVTPWLSRLWMQRDAIKESHGEARLLPLFRRIFSPFLVGPTARRNRWLLWLLVLTLITMSMLLPVAQRVILKMLPLDNKSEFQVVLEMPEGTALEQTAAVLREMSAHLATVPEVTDYQAYAGTAAPINFNGLVRQYYLREGSELGDIQVNLVDKHLRDDQSHAIAMRVRPALAEIARRHGGTVKVVEVPPGPPVLAPIVAEIYGPDEVTRRQAARALRALFERTDGVVDVDDTVVASAPRELLVVDQRKAALRGIDQATIVETLRSGLAGSSVGYLHDASKYPAPLQLQLHPQMQGSLDDLLALHVRAADGSLLPVGELVRIERGELEQVIHHKDLLPVTYVTGDVAGRIDSPLYAMFAMRGELSRLEVPGGEIDEHFIAQPADVYRGVALKWDGEWQITYETFRDMGAAYAVGLVLIYLLVVAHFGSYSMPLIIMAPIPLTLIGVMPGHALLDANFTATSMIGMIALAGIIVRNSILLVDFIRLQVAQGMSLPDAIVHATATRAQPIVLTALAAMLGALFILDDPIFNGLAVSLVFGILVSTLLTLVVIPLLYFSAYRRRLDAQAGIRSMANHEENRP